MVCPSCGSYVSDHSRFCTRCGSDVNGNASVDPKRYIVRGIKSAIPRRSGGFANAPSLYSAPSQGSPYPTLPQGQAAGSGRPEPLPSQQPARRARPSYSKQQLSAIVWVIILLAVIGIASIVNNGSGYEDDDYPGYPYYTEEEAANGLYSDDYVTVDFSVMGEDVGENGVFRLESTGEEFPIYGNGMNFEYMVAKTAEVDAATWASFDKSLGESESEESIFAYMSATYGQVVSLITKEYGMLGSETNADVKDVKFFPLDTDSGGVSAYMVGRLTDSATGDFNGCIGLALSESRHGYVCIIMQQSPGWNVGMEEDETIDRFSGLMEYGIWFADYGVDESDDIDDIDA